jgi:K+-transporting ATPase ATPase B chain
MLAQLPAALRKLDPRHLWRSPVMFIVWRGSVATTIAVFVDPSTFTIALAVWLWLTVVFGNLAEAVAEGRGKAQAASLRAARSDTVARVLDADGAESSVPGTQLKIGDLVLVAAGEVIPGDGDVVVGVASVDESAITGESAPVIREAGGDRSAVAGGTTVLSDEITVKITSAPGETFLATMIALVEGTSRRKTRNEIALSILLVSLTLVFVLAVATLSPMADYAGVPQDVTVLIALLVCLIPTTIGALLSAIGIAGMDRQVRVNVIAMSGRAVEAAGDVSTMLLDKTGTITYGNRQVSRFVPVNGVSAAELRDVVRLSSLADQTPEGRSIVALALTEGADDNDLPSGAQFIEFTAQTRMSGVGSRRRRAGRDRGHLERRRHTAGRGVQAGDTGTVLGVIHLKDVVKEGMVMVERFAQLRAMGIRTVMVTGDNALTAASIAAEAGVDDSWPRPRPRTRWT